jgi:chromosome segregation ATPase
VTDWNPTDDVLRVIVDGPADYGQFVRDLARLVLREREERDAALQERDDEIARLERDRDEIEARMEQAEAERDRLVADFAARSMRRDMRITDLEAALARVADEMLTEHGVLEMDADDSAYNRGLCDAYNWLISRAAIAGDA